MIKEKMERRAEIFHALGHPVRLSIVKGLSKDPCNVNKVVNRVNIPQSTVSQHLRVLKTAGIIRGERRGVQVCYYVTDDFVREVLKLI